VVGGAESGGPLRAQTWHGPTGPGDLPDEPELGGAGSADAPLSAAEVNLAEALRTSVSRVGRAGPPPGGLVRIRRKARARQRNRVVAAGSAGILMLAVAVTMATGARFDLVPTLTGASGASGGTSPGGQSGGGGSNPSAATNGGHAVWPTGSPGKVGLAIGPVSPVVATPSSLAAAQVPLCGAGSLKTSTTVGPTINGVVYGHVDAVAQSPCVAVGPPVLTVANQAGTASSSVNILKEDTTAASQLPSVPTWGRTMVLNPGQSYEFQFAWAATACAQGSASPVASPTTAASATSMYYLGYAVIGTTPTGVVTLNAPCGAQVYVTDIYNTGAFPLPKVSAPPPPVVSSSPAPPPPPSSAPPSPPTTAPPSSPAASPSPSPSESSSASTTSGLASGQATSPG